MKLNLLIIIICLLACSCTMHSEHEKLNEDAQELLFNVLKSNYKWEKIHAAEALISLGYSDKVRNHFLKEFELYVDSPQYRIGILRVLARSSNNDNDKSEWINKIGRIYKDTNNVDRLHASETLAKLNINLKQLDFERATNDLSSKDTLLKAFVTWGSYVSSNPDSTNFEGIMSMVTSPNETTRKIGGYAVSFCSDLPLDYRNDLNNIAQSEPNDSPAKIYLLKAASYFPNSESPPNYSSSIKNDLISFTTSSKRFERVEATLALAEIGDSKDLPILYNIFKDKNLQTSLIFNSEDSIDILLTTSYAILRINQRNGGGLGLLDWLVLGAYAILMIGIGFYYSTKNKNAEDYHLGGRSMNPILVGLSLFATILSTLSYLSYPGEMIKYGPVIFTSLLCFPLVYYLVGWHLIPKFMKMKVTSAYEILEIKIGLGVRILGTFFFISLRLLWMATIIYATVNTAIISIFGIERSFIPLICLIMAIITVIYTSMGGLKAVVITDTLQTVILLLGAILTLAIIAFQLGDIKAILPLKTPDHWESITWGLNANKRMTVSNAILMVFVWYICTAGSDQMAIQRYLATKDVRSARKTFGISIATNFISQVLLALVGLALLAYFTKKPYLLPVGENIISYADSLFPWFLVIGLPIGITGIVTAGLISAAMSSLSSGLNSTSSVISEDIIKRFSKNKYEVNYLKQARAISVIIGAIVTLLCLLVGYVQGNLLEVVIKVVNLFVAPLFVLFFMALFVPFSTQTGTIAGGIASVGTAVAIAFFEAFGLKVLWIMPVALFAGVLAASVISAAEMYIKSNLNNSKNEKMGI